jgi:hypothetical protein
MPISKYDTVSGALIANNVFYFTGTARNVLGGRKAREPSTSEAQKVLFQNNMYLNLNNLPSGYSDAQMIVGIPSFLNADGTNGIDFTPSNTGLMKNKSIQITNLPGDGTGLGSGFPVDKDFLGKPVLGVPDLGAIRINAANDRNTAIHNQFKVYPALTRDIVRIESILNELSEYAIVDFLGKKVKSGSFMGSCEIDLSEFPASVYFVIINNQPGTVKFIKY